MLDFTLPCWTSRRHVGLLVAMLVCVSSFWTPGSVAISYCMPSCWTPGRHIGVQDAMLDSRSPHIGLLAAMLDSWSPCWNVDRHEKARASANRGKREPRWLVGLPSRRNFKPAQHP